MWPIRELKVMPSSVHFIYDEITRGVHTHTQRTTFFFFLLLFYSAFAAVLVCLFEQKWLFRTHHHYPFIQLKVVWICKLNLFINENSARSISQFMWVNRNILGINFSNVKRTNRIRIHFYNRRIDNVKIFHSTSCIFSSSVCMLCCAWLPSRVKSRKDTIFVHSVPAKPTRAIYHRVLYTVLSVLVNILLLVAVRLCVDSSSLCIIFCLLFYFFRISIRYRSVFDHFHALT